MVTMRKAGQPDKQVEPSKVAIFTRQGWTQVADTEPEADEAKETVKTLRAKTRKGVVELSGKDEANAAIRARRQVYGSGALLPADQFEENETYEGTVTKFEARPANNQAGFATVAQAETETGTKVIVYPPQGGEFSADLAEAIMFKAVNVDREGGTALLAIEVAG